MNTYKIYKSDKPTKKYFVVTPDDKNIYFGASGYSDYTIHKDSDRKQRYINRHQKNENWNDPNKAGFWARWILWNKPTMYDSIRDTQKRFKIKILYFGVKLK